MIDQKKIDFGFEGGSIAKDNMSDIYSVWFYGVLEGQHYTMTAQTSDRINKWIDDNMDIYDECNEGELNETLIARNVTDLQCKKFENFVSFTQLTRQLVRNKYYNADNEYQLGSANSVDFEVKEYFDDEFLKELDISKWDPRSVLGKLEFDRRSEDAGIHFD